MIDTHQKKGVQHANVVSPIAAGIAGAVVGGVAVAAAVLMSDKKNQKKVADVLIDAKEKVVDYIDTVKSQPIVEKSTQKLEKLAKGVKEKIEEKM